MSLPVERGGLNEVHYDIVCVYSGDELPEEGTVMLADPELEFAWQTEQVWQLSGPQHTRVQELRHQARAEELRDRSIGAPRNLRAGFYGTWHRSTCDCRYGISALAAWHAMFDRFGRRNGTGRRMSGCAKLAD